LPDGTKTASYLPPYVTKIHTTREKVLRQYLASGRFSGNTALDVACHEGFFSLVLGEYFTKVTGIDKNGDSLALARQMGAFLKKNHVSFRNCPVENAPSSLKSEFVLCFGLLYHIENPIQILRKLAELTDKALCVETQVLPFDMSCRVEDGFYDNQRELKGLFGLCPDYPSNKEGGLTEYALVPSRDALVYMLRKLGFAKVGIYEPVSDDYEQFARGSRIILFAEKNA
jgi:ubiquinone/menaquinone biosynthesis C-methylase UbiE